ncbi:MAG: SDR family NAD(P)-dependent oxidoreductase [Terriglobia bacterium]
MDGKMYALVTGASGGIGERFAHALAARGRNLLLIARSDEKLHKLAKELAARHSIEAEGIAADLSEPGAAARLAGEIFDRKIAVSLLVNNAGFGGQGEFWRMPLDRQSQILRLNIHALVELCYFFLPAMIERKEGAIVNVSSTASFQPLPYTTLYAASKAFVTSFSMGLAEEVRKHGVKVVTLCPGPTQTHFFEAGGYRALRLRGRMQPPGEVVEAALRRLDRGGLVLCRPLDKVMVFCERFLPRGLIARGAAEIFKV